MAVSKAYIENRRINEIAEDYRRRGYSVTIDPPPNELPEFLKGYRPDLIAQRPDDSVVVEFKPTGRAPQTDYWSRLAETIQRQPGWRFELILEPSIEREPSATLTKKEIQEQLRASARLAEGDILAASLLLAWSALEAAMRLASKTYELEVADFRPSALISKLYSDGLIEREEYETLVQGMRARNAVAHGFREESLSPELIQQLHQIASRLIKPRTK